MFWQGNQGHLSTCVVFIHEIQVLKSKNYMYIRSGKKKKMFSNSKCLTPNFPHNIRIRLAQLLFFFFASWLCSVKFTFFSMSFCSKWAWSPPDNATPSDFPSAKSLVSELSVEVSFVSVIATVLSEYSKKLEEIFFCNNMWKLWKWYHFKKKSQAFFNILT